MSRDKSDRMDTRERRNSRDPRRDERFGRPYREVADRATLREGELEPRPSGLNCNPLCPFFRCGRKSLDVRSMIIGSERKVVGYCLWVGDQCIAGQCQFAYCEKRFLLPGNRCLYAIEKAKRRESLDMFRELDKEEKEARNLRDLLKKRGGKDLDLY
ncbi:MAG: hypothetical protein QXE32_00560 [Sulfolobales archaeon]